MSYKMTTPLTTEQFAANDCHYKTMIENYDVYIWKDTGNVYKCGEGTIKPQTTKGFIELVSIVSKDFARQNVSLPDIVEIKMPASSCNKEKLLEKVWSVSGNHNPLIIADRSGEKTEVTSCFKLKKGKKGRGKK